MAGLVPSEQFFLHLPPSHVLLPAQRLVVRPGHTYTHLGTRVWPPDPACPLCGPKGPGGVCGSLSCGFGAATWMSVAWPSDRISLKK